MASASAVPSKPCRALHLWAGATAPTTPTPCGNTSPHATRSDRDWCRDGDGVSVSFGVNFYTEATRRAARVHPVNRLLRKGLGIAPAFPGVSHMKDSIKEPVGKSLVVARQLARKMLDPLRRRPSAPTPPGAN